MNPIAVYYEHPVWFDRLFAEFDRRGAPYLKVNAADHFYRAEDPGEMAGASLVLNRMSPSAWRRGHGSAMLYTVSLMAHLEAAGKRVVNGERAFSLEVSKSRQLALLHSLGLPHPKSRVIHRPQDAPAASVGLRFPIVVKPNVGGSGAGVVRFDSLDELAEAAHGDLSLGLDGIGLVQEFIPARGGFISRVEGLDGALLYAIRVHLTGETFDLCPADICRSRTGEPLDTGCPIEAPKAGLEVEGFRPPDAVIAETLRVFAAAGIEVGGIEYVIDDRDGALYYYDINALSNFVSEGERVVGFDPFVPLVDFLIREAERAAA